MLYHGRHFEARRLVGGLVLAACCWALLWGDEVRADELSDLKELVDEQTSQIHALQDQVRKLEEESRNPVPTDVVETIDRRIIDFANHPSSNLFISGYGAAGYTDNEDSDGTFGMLFVPIFHYKLGERLHLTGEVEFDLRGDERDVAVEYAQIDFLVNDYLTLSAGKFLLPFNAFSERFHPSWINELPSLPPIYGGHHGGGGGIVPVLSDLGIQARGGLRLPLMIHEDWSRVNYAVYAVNGPRIEPESESDERFEHLAEFLADEGAIGDAEELLDELGIHEHGTEIEFGETLTDNNNNKAIGGRLGFLPIPSLEVGGSFMRGAFDNSSDLDLSMVGVDASWHLGPFDFRGEYIRLDFDLENEGDERVDGFYAQGVLTLRDLLIYFPPLRDTLLDRTELVFRYGEVDNETDYDEMTAGIVYWILPSVPLKLAHTFRDGDRRDDELQLQLAFGF